MVQGRLGCANSHPYGSGTGVAAHRAAHHHGTERVSSLLTVARYLDSLNLIPLLDELRDAYGVAKEAGHADLQARLMHARCTLSRALDQTINLHSEIAEFQQLSAQARANGAQPSTPGAVRAEDSEPNLRELS
jgi:hypothetical protein